MSDYSLQHPGGDVPLPVVPSTVGESGLNISSLLKETGHVTLDHGFVNTASCSSSITYIDGEAGILRYRGYPIEQLAEQSTFLEVAYLLLHGELPTEAEFEAWKYEITHHTFIHENMRKRFVDGFHYDEIAEELEIPMGTVKSRIFHARKRLKEELAEFEVR